MRAVAERFMITQLIFCDKLVDLLFVLSILLEAE